MISRAIIIRRLELVAAALLVAVGSLAAWAIAPFTITPTTTVRAAGQIVRAPFAERIIIGDSRIEFAEPVENALLIGYAGATTREMERMVHLTCSLSDAPMVIALGINDTIPQMTDLAASQASIERAIAACGAERVAISGIWLPDPQVEPLGNIYDLETLARLDALLEQVALENGAAFVPAPAALSGHTFDGAHFTPGVSRDYTATLLAGLADRGA
ncbi:SGNH/GDSL hydrolase family protein [Erythrobacter sp. EC-HK427]|uniref:SGNH/GDSL hydrolase family protein n=1 Tax=Erythrobacter sp. EC-HK427 TaxID=2038396 RepID=UPI00125B5584|nr:SGNH/GDSL hydrolase family protein [Erythrobacter sp. EC-HK427]VVT19357.1 conserved hypothetical protein [Erythrobacter sp. EC-HK427]